MKDIEKFKKKLDLTNKKIGNFFGVSRKTFTDSTAKKKYEQALYNFYDYVKKYENRFIKDRKSKTTSLDVIADAICLYFKLDSPKEFLIRTRKGTIITQRQWFHYFARTLNPEHTVSGETIGAYYEDITNNSYKHATVLNSVKKIKGYLEYSKQDMQIEYEIMNIIKSKTEFNYKPSLKWYCNKMIYFSAY